MAIYEKPQARDGEALQCDWSRCQLGMVKSETSYSETVEGCLPTVIEIRRNKNLPEAFIRKGLPRPGFEISFEL